MFLKKVLSRIRMLIKGKRPSPRAGPTSAGEQQKQKKELMKQESLKNSQKSDQLWIKLPKTTRSKKQLKSMDHMQRMLQVLRRIIRFRRGKRLTNRIKRGLYSRKHTRPVNRATTQVLVFTIMQASFTRDISQQEHLNNPGKRKTEQFQTRMPLVPKRNKIQMINSSEVRGNGKRILETR